LESRQTTSGTFKNAKATAPSAPFNEIATKSGLNDHERSPFEALL
jgi:hypothetical protein